MVKINKGGGGTGVYNYIMHNGHAVVSTATATISQADMDKGTDTTSCTQSYSRSLDDDGVQDCDAGHILAHRLGGPGNQPINIFPQVRLFVIIKFYTSFLMKWKIGFACESWFICSI